MTTSIKGKRVAFLATDGVEEVEYTKPREAVEAAGGTAELVSIKDDRIQAVNHMDKAGTYPVDRQVRDADAERYDALVLPNGPDAVAALRADGHTLEFIKDQYRHCKPILALGASEQLLEACGIGKALPDGQPDSGLLVSADAATVADAFIGAIAKHRHFARETDPPRV